MNLLSSIILLIAGLVGPGWLLGRALRCPAGVLGAFIGSLALLMGTLLALDASTGSFAPPALALGLALVCAILVLAARARPRPPPAQSPARQRFKFEHHHWILLPAAVGFIAIVAKAWFDPLSGLDTKFRWDFLAREMLSEGNLDFYPAVLEDHFRHYPWCDGIAPLISSLYYLAYLCFGSTDPRATAPVVIGQALLLFVAVYKLAECRGGPAAGSVAASLLATSAVLLSGVAMGQETGMTALTLAAMFLFIERYREAGLRSWLVWAGLAAGVGSLAREYGIIYAALGVVMLGHCRAPLRSALLFLVSALAVMLPWYLRNWIKTGHPLYSHAIGGLFPANPVHMDYMRAVGEVFGLADNPVASIFLATSLVTLAGVPILLGLLGMGTRGRGVWPWSVAFAVMVAIWLWSVHQTSGGYHYSLRALTPALAMAAVFGGLLLARVAGSQRAWLVAVLLSLPAIDAAQRSMFMPLDPMVKWWTIEPLAWREHRQRTDRWEADGNWKAVTDSADSHMILTNNPFTWVRLRDRGGRCVPIFSPAIRYLFAPDATVEASAARLRAGGFRFIVLTRHDHPSNIQLDESAFFHALNQISPTATVPFGQIYDLYSLPFAPGAGTSASSSRNSSGSW